MTSSKSSGTPNTGAGGDSRAIRVLASAIAAFIVVALSSSVKTVIPPNLELVANAFASSVSAVALGPTVFMVVNGLSSPLVGLAADRFGSYRVIVAGLLLSGSGLILCGLSRNPLEFGLSYGLVCGLGFTAVSYVPITLFVEERIPLRFRGTAFAILSNGTAIGFVLLSPVWIHLARDTSFRAVFLLIGLTLALPVAGLAAFFLRPSRPAARRGADGPTAPQPAPKPPASRFLRQLARNRTYVVFVGAFFSCGLSMGLVDVHIVHGLHDGGVHGAAVGASVATLGIFELIMGVFAGRAVDRGWLHATSAIAYAVRAAGLLLLAMGLGNLGGFAFAILFGSSYLGTVVAATRAVCDSAAESAGMALGIMWLLHQAGAALSSQLGAYSIDHWGTVTPVVALIAVMCLASAVATAFPTRVAAGGNAA